jgi:phospholipid-binding lipoprotein MlaA
VNAFENVSEKSPPDITAGETQPAESESPGTDDYLLEDEEEIYDDEDEFAEEEEVSDSLEPWNRAMFVFNDKLYFMVMKPVAENYRDIFPQTVRIYTANFFTNLYFPVRFLNSLLQGKGEAMEREFARFLANSTVGVLGFGNPAENNENIKISDEDFGQTLGRYGVGDGAYVVWPFWGPSTLRDTAGDVCDQFADPLSYVGPMGTSVGTTVLKKTNSLSFKLGDYEAFKKAAFEPYLAVRNAYFQSRTKKIKE